MPKHSKQVTRLAILSAARTVLACDGPEALSLTQVASLAGVNRGTAYQHFATREALIKATVASVGEMLSERIFGQLPAPEPNFKADIRSQPISDAIAGLVEFSVDNPSLGRIWLFTVLSSDNPSEDVFFRQFKETTRQLAVSEYSQANIDVEALSVIILAGYFLWPQWVAGRAKDGAQKEHMIERMRQEVLRLFMYGVLKPDCFPELTQLLGNQK